MTLLNMITKVRSMSVHLCVSYAPLCNLSSRSSHCTSCQPPWACQLLASREQWPLTWACAGPLTSCTSLLENHVALLGWLPYANGKLSQFWAHLRRSLRRSCGTEYSSLIEQISVDTGLYFNFSVYSPVPHSCVLKLHSCINCLRLCSRGT